MEQPIEATRRFCPIPENVSAVRRFVAAEVAERGAASCLETAVLLASEVATNVVVHAGPHSDDDEMVATVASTADAVRVEVTDRHDGVPLLGRPSPVDGLSGRGLLLVEALASTWGVTPASAGKVVWFEVPHYGSSAA